MIRLCLCIVAVSTLACGGSSDRDRSEEESSVELPVDGVYGVAPPASGGIPSVVTMDPVRTGDPATRTVDAAAGSAITDGGAHPGSVASIDQFGLAFSPTQILVHPGRVSFTNSESALAHNVHVRSLEQNATIYEEDALPGDELSVELLVAGGYDVLCDMHPGMTAFVFVTDAPYAQLAATDGAFDLGAVPPGEYRVRLWTADRGFHAVIEVTVGPGPTEVDLRASN